MKEIDLDRATLLCTYVRSCTELAEHLVFDYETKTLNLTICDQFCALFEAARIFNGALFDVLLGGDGALPYTDL